MISCYGKVILFTQEYLNYQVDGVREIALHVLDLLQNTVEAGATRVDAIIAEDWAADCLRVTISDNGRGMDAQTAARAADPFYTSRRTRHVGLGLPLLAAAAERAGGGLAIHTQPGAGTTVEATFRLSHPDRQPLGNLADTLLAFLLAGRAPDLHYVHRKDKAGNVLPATFEFDTASIRAVLGDLPMTHPAVQQWLADFLTEGEETFDA
jgi:hypothetical protein